MAIDLDIEELRKILIEIYENFIKDPSDLENNKKVRELYGKYCGADDVLPPSLAIACRVLVDIGYDTGHEVDKKLVQEILTNLKEFNDSGI